MALTWTIQDPPVFAEFTGQKGYKRARVNFDSTYPAGGEAFTAADLGLATVDNLQITIDKPLTGTTSATISWDRANSKLQMFASNGAAPAALVEVAAVDQSAVFANVLAYGKLL